MKYIKYLVKLLILQSFFILFMLYIVNPISIGILNNIVNYNNIVLLVTSYIAISFIILYYINCIITFNITKCISYTLYSSLFTLKIRDNYLSIIFIIVTLLLSKIVIPLFLVILLVLLVGKWIYSYVYKFIYKNTMSISNNNHSYLLYLKHSSIFIFKYILVSLIIIFIIYMLANVISSININYKFVGIYLLDIFLFISKSLFVPLYLYNIQHLYIKDTSNVSLSTLEIIYILIFMFICSYHIYTVSKDQLINKYTTIIAHRGDSINYIENSKEAILSAINNNIEYIEIDVMNTKDNITIIHHDKTTKRISNKNKRISKTVYDKLENDVYSIPTLEDILVISQNRVKLLIELKGNSNKQLLVKSVINLVYKYNMEDDVIITSLNKDMLEELIKQDNKIKTGYITYNYTTCYNSDYLLINKNCVVDNPFKNNILLWTVNTEREIKSALERDIKYIISDDIELCKSLIYEHLIDATNSSNIFKQKLLVHFVNYWFHS